MTLNNVIPFVKTNTDVLTNRDVLRMMRQYYTSGEYRSMREQLTVNASSATYAEILADDVDDLALYGTHCPIHLVRAPKEIESFPFLYRDNLAQRVQRIINVAWFHWYEVSPGVLSMLLGKPGNRLKAEIAECLYLLIECEAITKTDRLMKQPFKPKGVRFSAYENQVFAPTRKNLYRCIETAVYLMSRMERVHQQFSQTMNIWTNQPWPHIDNAAPRVLKETKHRAIS